MRECSGGALGKSPSGTVGMSWKQSHRHAAKGATKSSGEPRRAEEATESTRGGPKLPRNAAESKRTQQSPGEPERSQNNHKETRGPAACRGDAETLEALDNSSEPQEA
eukprot:5465625-Alexandrium_andersonii.AAC.1